MTQQTPSTGEAQPARHEGITEIAVQGFKSLSHESRIEVRPLTILAGANSSGKSSIMQPLLLMKQTLDASSDPGPLLLNGPNAKFTSARQFLPPAERQSGTQKLSVEMILASHLKCKTTFEFSKHDRPQISAMQIVDDTEHRSLYLTPHQSSESLMDQLLASNQRWGERLKKSLDVRLSVSRSRCFLNIHLDANHKDYPQLFGLNMYLAPVSYEPVTEALNRLIHVPGLRGNRGRLFVTIASGPPVPRLVRGVCRHYHWRLAVPWGRAPDAAREHACEPSHDARSERQARQRHADRVDGGTAASRRSQRVRSGESGRRRLRRVPGAANARSTPGCGKGPTRLCRAAGTTPAPQGAIRPRTNHRGYGKARCQIGGRDP